MNEQHSTENDRTCRNCGKPIREGEKGVNWPWIHASGWYRCAQVVGSTKAEPCVTSPEVTL